MAANLHLDLIELADAFQQISGERCRLGRVDVEDFAPEICTRSVSIRISRAEISAWATANAASSSAIRASLSGVEKPASDTTII
jgi:hypothetical protein